MCFPLNPFGKIVPTPRAKRLRVLLFISLPFLIISSILGFTVRGYFVSMMLLITSATLIFILYDKKKYDITWLNLPPALSFITLPVILNSLLIFYFNSVEKDSFKDPFKDWQIIVGYIFGFMALLATSFVLILATLMYSELRKSEFYHDASPNSFFPRPNQNPAPPTNEHQFTAFQGEGHVLK